MVKENALMRTLPAVETLGSSTVICSDKTGTLTQNRMVITSIVNNDDLEKVGNSSLSNLSIKDQESYKEILYASALCNDAALDPNKEASIIGDPTEGALIFLAKHFGIEQEDLENRYPRLLEQPFDSIRKRMTTVHSIEGELTAYTKGAVDELLNLCSHILTPTGIRKITKIDKARILEANQKMAGQALRVLGFAKKKLSSLPSNKEANFEYDLTFLGMVGMIDPPKEEVYDSIKTCKKAGIRIIMITGDHLLTAKAIAKEIGILEDDSGSISGEKLDSMTEEELNEVASHTTVFARVSPNHKLKIVQALKRNGEVVAMTGDGVNDAPALKSADIGISMGMNGTDVAKDASDMVLLDDDFTTIVYAVKEGRRVYRNIQKVIQFLLAGNIAEILTLFIATLFNWEAPILAIHILFINLATDTLPALALGVDPSDKNIMNQKPIKSGSLFEKSLVSRVILHGIFITIITLIAYQIGLHTQGHSVGQTMAFFVLAISQMLHAFNQRSNSDSIFTKGNGHNYFLLGALLLSSLILSCIEFIPRLRNLFQLSSLTGFEWSFVLILSIIPILLVEFVKLFKRIFKWNFI